MKNALCFLLCTTMSASLSCVETPTPKKIGVGDFACAATLFLGGSWLAHKQIPRLAGQTIEYSAPQFTKAFASVLFLVGIAGGTVGAYSLIKHARDRLNKN